MPFLLLGLVLLLPLVFVALLPLSLIQRYRAGTSRRLGRSWVATLNASILGFSALLFIVTSALMSAWVPQALLYVVAGLIGGSIVGLLGLKLTHWEPTDRGLHYTPHRLLVLVITIAAAGRLLNGFWRAWQTWEHAGSHSSWLVASGAGGSMAAGAVVLGYYFTYWSGVARRVKRQSSARGLARW